MTPLSVFRIWGLGIFSWALLGAGIYLATLAYEEFNPATRVTASRIQNDSSVAADRRDAIADADVDGSLAAEIDTDREPVVAASNDWDKWWYLAGAIVCLGLTVGGRFPVSLILGGPAERFRPGIEPSRTLLVDRSDGTKIHAAVYGESSADTSDARPTIILTHGWSLDGSAWDYMKRRLAERHRVITWDLAGLGRSMRPSNLDHSLEKMAHDLAAVVQATAPGAPVVLVGHSIGGMILQTYSRVHADQLGSKVKGLALFHTTYKNPLRTMIASDLVTALQYPVIVPLNYLTIGLSALAWLSNWQSYWNGSLHISTRLISFSGKQSYEQIERGAKLAARAWPATLARGNLAMLAFDEEATLPSINVPVLVVGGTNDIVTKHSASEHIKRALPNDRPADDDGGHLGYWEYTQQVTEDLLEFVESVASRSETLDRTRVGT